MEMVSPILKKRQSLVKVDLLFRTGEASSLILMEEAHKDNFDFYRYLCSEFVEVSINERVNR